MVKENANVLTPPSVLVPAALLGETRDPLALNLRSAVLHYGSSATTGHYVSVLCHSPSKMVLIDDADVREVGHWI